MASVSTIALPPSEVVYHCEENNSTIALSRSPATYYHDTTPVSTMMRVVVAVLLPPLLFRFMNTLSLPSSINATTDLLLCRWV
ncbi:hypothetical protein HYC85_021851 [Camellia sinensis]|uniref:Uncharacterized protein n=1 Tax=Camellia sinensis TaxID=4442 RepID=A0A7J7GMN3_CAMSI|nr:hypothetical protein HYC85_021851 [Camellia sinensis]